MLGACLLLIDSSDNLGTICNRLLGMESTVFTGHALHKYFGVLIDENVWLRFLGISSTEQCVNDLVSLWIAHVLCVGRGSPNRS